MARSIGSLFVNIVAKTSKFEKGIDKAGKKLTRFQKLTARVSSNLQTFGTAAIAGAAGGLLYFAKAQINALDALGKTASKLGETAENLSALHHAAALSGVSVNTFNMAIQRMTRRVAEAARGTGEAKDAIKELGLDAGTLKGVGPAAALMRVAGAMQHVKSQGDRVRIAMKLFDSEGVALVNMLNNGSAGLQQLIDKAKVIGTKSTQDAQQFNDALTQLTASFSELGRSITIGFVTPLRVAIQAMADYITMVSKMPEFYRMATRPAGGSPLAGGGGNWKPKKEHVSLGASQSAWDLSEKARRVSQSQWTASKLDRIPGTTAPNRETWSQFQTHSSGGRSLGALDPAAQQARGGAGIGAVMSAFSAVARSAAMMQTAAKLSKGGGGIGTTPYAGLYEKGTASAYSRQLGRKDPQQEMNETTKKQYKELQLHTSMFKDWGEIFGRTVAQVVTIPGS